MEDRTETPRKQPDPRFQAPPADELVGLKEIEQRWGVHYLRVYEAAREGRIRAYRRGRSRRYYSAAEIEREFGDKGGEPPPAQDRAA